MGETSISPTTSPLSTGNSPPGSSGTMPKNPHRALARNTPLNFLHSYLKNGQLLWTPTQWRKNPAMKKITGRSTPPELLESRSRKRWYSLSFVSQRTQAQIDEVVALVESHEVVVSDEQDGGRLCACRECPRTSRHNPFSPASPPKSPEFGRISGVPSTLAAVTDRRSGYRPRSREYVEDVPTLHAILSD